MILTIYEYIQLHQYEINKYNMINFFLMVFLWGEHLKNEFYLLVSLVSPGTW